MTTFQLIVLVMFVMALAAQFVIAIERNCLWLATMFGFEICAFAYLAQQLM